MSAYCLLAAKLLKVLPLQWLLRLKSEILRGLTIPLFIVLTLVAFFGAVILHELR